MLWLMTMGRRLNGVYAAFMLVAFMMGVAGALQAPTLSLFLSREVGAQPFWIGLFYTVNAIAGILVSLGLALAGLLQGRAVPVLDPGHGLGLEVRAQAHAATQAKAKQAWAEGRFDREISPIEAPVIALVPAELATKHKVLPLQRSGNVLTLVHLFPYLLLAGMVVGDREGHELFERHAVLAVDVEQAGRDVADGGGVHAVEKSNQQADDENHPLIRGKPVFIEKTLHVNCALGSFHFLFLK